MDATTQDRIKADFLTWSGGTPPDSKFEVFTYVQAARPSDTDETDIYCMLKDWMEAEWRDG